MEAEPELDQCSQITNRKNSFPLSPLRMLETAAVAPPRNLDSSKTLSVLQPPCSLCTLPAPGAATSTDGHASTCAPQASAPCLDLVGVQD